MNANDKQVGGTHYKGALQPWDFIISNNLGYLEGTAIKYLTRWRKKNGIEDLRKAIHFIEKLIEVELANPSASGVERNVNHVGLQRALVDNGISPRLRDALAMANEAGSTDYFLPNGELNNTEIIRADDGQH